MHAAILIVKNSWNSFLRSDRSVFLVYAILIVVWSIVLASNMHQLALEANTLWWVFFSVVISGNFSSTAFTAERLTGSLEIVLTSGLSRMGILVGKLAYVILMSVALGMLSYGLGLAWLALVRDDLPVLIRAMDFANLAALYMAACFMNASCGAWLSVHLANPRLSHFATLLVLGVIVGVHAVLTASMPVAVSAWILPAALLVVGSVFFTLAVKDFSGEKVVQPFTY